jgi:hypothetical protein
MFNSTSAETTNQKLDIALFLMKSIMPLNDNFGFMAIRILFTLDK